MEMEIIKGNQSEMKNTSEKYIKWNKQRNKQSE